MLGWHMYLSNDPLTKCDIWLFGHVTNTYDIPTLDIPTFDIPRPTDRFMGSYALL